jgi:hypothetical protein
MILSNDRAAIQQPRRTGGWMDQSRAAAYAMIGLAAWSRDLLCVVASGFPMVDEDFPYGRD